MRINTNINAMTALNQSTKNTALAGNSMAKLSSGLRINKAGDDAAGLAISEKMRSQIRGMEQAEKNTQDGISAIQTAEGAMEEIGNIGQRMRELTVQSSNETNSVEDREKIAEELKQLHSEIDRIAETTEFNGKKLLNGNSSNGSSTNENTKISHSVSIENGTIINGTDDVAETIGVAVSGNISDIGAENISIKYEANVSSGNIDATITLLDKDGNTLKDANGDAIKSTVSTGVATGTKLTANVINFKFEDADGNTLKDANGNDIKITLTSSESVASDLTSISTIKEISGNIKETITPVNSTNISFGNTGDITKMGANDITGDLKELGVDSVKITGLTGALKFELLDKDGNTIGKSDQVAGTASQTIVFKNEDGNTLQDASGKDVTIKGNFTTANTNIATIKEYVGKFNPDENITSTSGKEMSLDFQVGANADQNMEVKISNIKTENLGLDLGDIEALANKDLKAGTEAANSYIKKIDSALEKVNTSRANLGAYQNRLEYAQNNLTTSNENLTAAESRIRDVDVAKEMMNLSKLNLLNQASQAMMTQAKSQPEGVMQLLR